MRSLFAACLSVSVISILFAVSSPQASETEGFAAPATDVARMLAVSELVAVIEPLPDEVSNGTWCYLDARNSTYTNGTIDHYHWELYLKDVLKNTYDESFVEHKFRQVGLWKIYLTITTNDSKTAMGFSAVVSIADSDYDGLPDWWELHYFTTLSQDGVGDYDNDGYTNLQEYASDMDPSVKNSGAFLAMIADGWYYIVAAAAIVAVAVIMVYQRLKRKRKAEVKKQIEAAIEIEKALEEEK